MFQQELHEKCPYLKFFWSVFSRFGMNTDQKTLKMDTFYAEQKVPKEDQFPTNPLDIKGRNVLEWLIKWELHELNAW